MGTVLEGGRGRSPEAHLSPWGRGWQRLRGGAPLRVAWEGAGEPEGAAVQPSPADLPPGLSSDRPPLLQARVKAREPASPLTAPVPVFYEPLISPGLPAGLPERVLKPPVSAGGVPQKTASLRGQR